MIVAVIPRNGEEDVFHEDIAAVVYDGDGWIRLCRDGREDELLQNVRVVVTP